MRHPDRRNTVPFGSVEAAWFWAFQSLHTEGRAVAAAAPCRVEEIVKCLDVLYRQRRVELLHARILRFWGARGVAPNPARPRERSDWRVWHEAMERLDGPLRARGIVAGPFAGNAD